MQAHSVGNSDPLLPICRICPVNSRCAFCRSRYELGARRECFSRDLLVSPDHALLVDGALIQAGALINGLSIPRESKMPTVFTYYHVEVEDHSLILAENTPAETFVDNVDRLNFDNWHEHEV